MKIVCPFFIFGRYGGVRVVTQILSEWSQNNKVVILTIGNEEPYFPISDKIEIIRCKNKMEIVRYLYKGFKEFDAIIGVYAISAYLIFAASILRGCFQKNYYYIQAYEGEYDFAGKSRFWLTLVRLSYKLPFHRIVNAPIYLDYKDLHARDVVFPGLDLSLYYPKKLEYFNKTLKVGCIGRIEEWKGIGDVCKAVEMLKDEGFDMEFFIAFNDFDTVEHHFVKPDGDENLAAFYRDMDIIVAPGHIQLGAVHYPVIEAMAVGTTVVTTGYFPADCFNSYIVGVKKPEEIANTIIEINDDRLHAIEKRRKALEDVQQFAWSNVATKFMSIIYQGEEKNDHAE